MKNKTVKSDDRGGLARQINLITVKPLYINQAGGLFMELEYHYNGIVWAIIYGTQIK